jgi:hypothetical protein
MELLLVGVIFTVFVFCCVAGGLLCVVSALARVGIVVPPSLSAQESPYAAVPVVAV